MTPNQHVRNMLDALKPNDIIAMYTPDGFTGEPTSFVLNKFRGATSHQMGESYGMMLQAIEEGMASTRKFIVHKHGEEDAKKFDAGIASGKESQRIKGGGHMTIDRSDQPCTHDHLTEEGQCRRCGNDCRGIG